MHELNQAKILNVNVGINRFFFVKPIKQCESNFLVDLLQGRLLELEVNPKGDGGEL